MPSYIQFCICACTLGNKTFFFFTISVYFNWYLSPRVSRTQTEFSEITSLFLRQAMGRKAQAGPGLLGLQCQCDLEPLTVGEA